MPDTSISVPIRDAADIVVVQTAITGEAELICTVDADFHEPLITRFLSRLGIKVLDDVALMQILRASIGERSS